MNRFVSLLALSALLVTPHLHAQSAVDERAIIEVAHALDAALDDKDWERARRLLLDQVTVERPDSEPMVIDADELIEQWRANLHAEKISFHLRGGEIVLFDGADSALLRSKARVQFAVAGIPGDDGYSVSRDYTFELDRVDDRWRIRRHAYVTRMEDGNPAVLDHRLPVEESAAEGDEGETDGGEGDDGQGDDGQGDAGAAGRANDQGVAEEAANGDTAATSD